MSEEEEDDERDIALWLFNVRDKLDELVDLYNEADDVEEMSMDSVREIFDVHIDTTGQIVDLLRVLAYNLKIMNNALVSIKELAPNIRSAIDDANLGESSGTFKTILLIIGILLFIFALVGILTGRVI